MRFAAAKLMSLCCEVAHVCQNRFRNCEIPCGMRLLLRNLGFTTSQVVSQLPNEGSYAAKWHSCAKFAFAAAKYPRRDFYSVVECLATKCSFRRSFLHSAKFRRALFLLCFLPDFFSFNFLEISSTWDHSKRLKHT